MVSVLTLVWPLALPTTVCVTFSFYLKPTLFPFAKCSAHTSGLKLHRQVDNPARTSYRYEGLPCPLFWAASALPQPYRDIVINNNKNNRPARDCLERLCWMVCVRVTLYLPRKQNKPCSDSAWAWTQVVWWSARSTCSLVQLIGRVTTLDCVPAAAAEWKPTSIRCSKSTTSFRCWLIVLRWCLPRSVRCTGGRRF